MKILTSFQERLGFTNNEVKVILFLATTFLLGLSIRWYTSSQQPIPSGIPSYDYSASDREFTERSRNLPAASARSSDVLTAIPGLPALKAAPLPAGFTVNINTAEKSELMKLPGIGPAFADRIIAWRQSNGAFASVDDLDRVRGIGKKMLERIRPFVRVQ